MGGWFRVRIPIVTRIYLFGGPLPRAGDIAVVRTRGFGAWLIRVGTRSKYDHVVIFVDDNGAIAEAEPGGVRYGHISEYRPHWTLTNAAQPKTEAQRAAVVAIARAFADRNAPYDWAAITADVSNAFDIRDPFVREFLPGVVPARVVCSAMASYAYLKADLAEPTDHGIRECTPADWARFIMAG